MKRLLIAVAVLCLSSASAFPKTIHVPGDFPTIQEAINKALWGDDILVDPGTYFECINFQGKQITVKSTQGPEATVIDAWTSSPMPKGSVATFACYEGPDRVLEGFTLKNGIGTLGPYDLRFGGGVYCYKSSPTIIDNIIEDNTADYGGGVYCGKAKSAIIENVIRNNTANEGGGIECEGGSAAIITGNHIAHNAAIDGGGVYVSCSGDSFIALNLISENEADSFGGGVYCVASEGITISSNWVVENAASAGGGFYLFANDGSTSNNVISGNIADYVGGGVCLKGEESTLTNYTIVQNRAVNGGGGLHLESSYIVIVNSVLWGNIAPKGGEMLIGEPWLPSKATMKFSLVEGGKSDIYLYGNCALVWGKGMIEEDPAFLDPLNGDFRLTKTSHCINMGTNADAPSEDIDGNPRPYMGTVDMGAYEFLGEHFLGADVFEISEATGGTVSFDLNGGAQNGGRGYIMLGSITGSAPGIPLPGGMELLPLNWDFFTSIMVGLINTPIFANFMGSLDASGKGYAALDTLGPVPGTASVEMVYAFGLANPYDLASNPVVIRIVP